MPKLDHLLRRYTQQAVEDNFWEYRRRQEADPPRDNSITFLGTGGNPEAIITQQPRTAGFVLQVGGVRIYVDPGPGAAVRARQMQLDLGQLDAIYISHGHLDHYGGAEEVIEAMCWAMYARRGYLLAPANIFTGEGILSYYHQGDAGYGNYKGGPQIINLQPYQPIAIKNTVLTPIPAYHTKRNFGFVLDAGGVTIGYTSDTNYILRYSTPRGVMEVGKGHYGTVMDFEAVVAYRQEIKEAFQGVDVLVANVTTHNSWFHRHLTTLGLAHLLKHSQVKLCFLTHFNHSCVHPVDVRGLMAQYIQEATGIKALAAYDGAVHQLDLLLDLMEGKDEKG